MGPSTATVALSAVSVRRARRSNLGSVFTLIQRAWGGQLPREIAREQFEPHILLWVNNLRARGK